MIRRDFILRQVQELAQVLARAVFLRTRREYESAIREVGRALNGLGQGQPVDGLSAEGWLALCRRHEGVAGELMPVVAGLLREQASTLQALGRGPESDRARSIALTLHLEAVLTGATPITKDVLDQTDRDISALPVEALPPVTLSRLFAYCEQRGRWAAAEDVLFDWLERGDPLALPAGREFYARLGGLSAGDLEAGGLSPEEVAEGAADLERIAARGEAN